MKTTYCFLAVLLLAAALLFAGCTSTQGSTTEHWLYTNDSGKTIDANIGDTIIVSLDENPTTGYSWDLNGGGLTLVSDNYTVTSPELMGSGGVHVWNFSASSEGIYEITGIYMRPWENATASDETWNATVVVK